MKIGVNFCVNNITGQKWKLKHKHHSGMKHNFFINQKMCQHS